MCNGCTSLFVHKFPFKLLSWHFRMFYNKVAFHLLFTAWLDDEGPSRWRSEWVCLRLIVLDELEVELVIPIMSSNTQECSTSSIPLASCPEPFADAVHVLFFRRFRRHFFTLSINISLTAASLYVFLCLSCCSTLCPGGGRLDLLSVDVRTQTKGNTSCSALWHAFVINVTCFSSSCALLPAMLIGLNVTLKHRQNSVCVSMTVTWLRRASTSCLLLSLLNGLLNFAVEACDFYCFCFYLLHS